MSILNSVKWKKTNSKSGKRSTNNSNKQKNPPFFRIFRTVNTGSWYQTFETVYRQQKVIGGVHHTDSMKEIMKRIFVSVVIENEFPDEFPEQIFVYFELFEEIFHVKKSGPKEE